MKYGKGKGGWSTKVCRRAHGCGLWRSISERWESFSKHLTFVVGDGSHIYIYFWHDRWIEDNPLKTLYPGLYECSDNKEAHISDVFVSSNGCNLGFYRNFHDWELEASFSFLHLVQSWIPGMLEVTVFVGALMEKSLILGLSTIRFRMFLLLFSLEGIWKVKVPKKMAFFMWTIANSQILTLDNLMLQGHPLANQCCMCCCNKESVDHFLIFCPLAHSLWVHML